MKITDGKIAGLTGYEIKQGLNGGQITIHLSAVNPHGRVELYSEFIEDLKRFLESR